MLHSVTLQAIGRQVYTAIPGNIIAVFRPAELLQLATSGLAIAAAGALLTASWAAASEPPQPCTPSRQPVAAATGAAPITRSGAERTARPTPQLTTIR